MPFLLYDYQKEFVKWVNDLLKTKEDGLLEKARDMGATWLGMGEILNHWLHDDGFSCHLGSRKEEYVDKKKGNINTLFGKIRYMLMKLPAWMYPEGFDWRQHSSHLIMVNPTNGNVITGESSNNDFGRQARASMVWMDEFAHWDSDEDSWGAVSEVSPCKIVVSSVKGRHNTYARLRFDSKIKLFVMDWTEHPEKTQGWYDNLKSSGKMTAEQIAS